MRKIYMIEAFSETGDLLMRRFAANKKTAERIAKPYGEKAVVRLTQKAEWEWINKADVERL